MIYKEKLRLNKDDFKYYNELLQLDLDESLPFYNKNDIERLNAKKDDYIGIADITFKNGNYITIDLASGSSNYYDNIVLWNKNEDELYVLECDYTIGSFEFNFEDDTYIIEIEIK